MSEETVVATPTKTPKKEVIKISVTMTDGRVVEFPETQSVKREVLFDAAGVAIGCRFDFKNSETRTFFLSDAGPILAYAAAHGLIQKIGDEWAGAKDPAGQAAGVDDIVLICDEIMSRLKAGDWFTERKGGESLAGASVVIQALVALTKESDPNGVGKTPVEIKKFLDDKLAKLEADAKAAGQKPPSRNALYQSYRKPGTKSAAKIAELEAAKAAKNAVVDADDEVNRLLAS